MPLLSPREVKTITLAVAATSVTRATIITPTAGTRVRIISVSVAAHALTTDPGRVGVYFGTGAAYATNTTTVIGEIEFHKKDTTYSGYEVIGPFAIDNGPIGAKDAVVSWATEIETETAMRVTVVYTEEV